jgi:predicted methyltransferase
MTRSLTRALRALALVMMAACASADVWAGDLYDAAVAHPGRTPKDIQRDAIDHPAEVLRLAGIQPGMVVVDFFGAGGYYSELLSYVVGPGGTSTCSTTRRTMNSRTAAGSRGWNAHRTSST